MNFDGTNKVKIKLPDEVKLTPPAEASAPSAHETIAASTPLKRARSINLQEYLEHGLSELKEQLNHYQEVCARFAAAEWRLPDVTDYLFIMVKSLNFDALSVMVVDQSNPERFLPMVSRGYFHPPTIDVEHLWQQSLHENGGTVNWDKLLELTQREQSPLVDWMESEKIHRIGYSPIQDGDQICGFITVASYAEKKLSPLASILLELCGGHIGLAMTAWRAKHLLSLHQRPPAIRAELLTLKSLLQNLVNAESLTGEELLKTINKSQTIIDGVLEKNT